MPSLVNIGQLVRCLDIGLQGEIHAIKDACLEWEGDRITWAGPGRLPAAHQRAEAFDAAGKTVIPGLIDCHTHLAFGGWRADEFEQRIHGASYQEIARQGGGIRRTVRQTAELTEDQLFARCLDFLTEMRSLGVTCIECKSGYGLSSDQELKTLRVYRRLAAAQPVGIIPTFLAHIVPPERAGDRARYVKEICEETIPTVAERGLAQICDIFVEEGAFTPGEARVIASAAREHGLAIKLHADQLTDGGGARLAAELGALSADHLEMISEAGIEHMARSAVVAVSLPLASLYLNNRPLCARRLTEAGIPVAVATDFNPGSAPSFHLPLALMLACNLQRMTPAEAVKGATIYAARAIGHAADRGSLEPGKRADFAIIDAPDILHWLYHFRGNACRATFIAGSQVYGEPLTWVRLPSRPCPNGEWDLPDRRQMLKKAEVPLPAPRAGDHRIGHLLAVAHPKDDQCRVVIVGFPVDEGVRRNGGRPGAAAGPDAIRARFYALTPDARNLEPFASLLSKTRDLGNLAVTGDLESDQQQLGQVLAPWISRGAIPIVLGGGHETAYGHFLGYVAAGGSAVEIVNWDAHPDVRELRNGLGHSGSPFRQALCHPANLCRKYTVAGLLPQSVASAHVAFIQEGGNRVFWRNELSGEKISAIYAGETFHLAVSFDLDAVDGASAPGVSAPSVDGLPAQLWLEVAYLGGLCPRATSFDLCELNPRFDVDDRTARLAALTVWQILRGIAARVSP